MRRLALAAALAAVAVCASAPRVSRREGGVVLVQLTLDYGVDVAHPWESRRSADDLLSRAMEVRASRCEPIGSATQQFKLTVAP